MDRRTAHARKKTWPSPGIWDGLGASVMLIGQDLSEGAADLVFQLPQVLAAWQFMIEIIPAQLAAERLSRLSGVDCDSFKLCSFIVEDDSGLLGGADQSHSPKDTEFIETSESMIAGVDIGGTKVAVGVVDHHGRVLSSRNRQPVLTANTRARST